LAARLPFAIAGLATVLTLFHLVRKYSSSLSMAVLAALFLLCNLYWILHARQCRYYSLSSLFLVLTLLGYARWQESAKGGACAFVAMAWCFFQVDYSTVWPVLAVLSLDAFLRRRTAAV
jgi:4-amino-4-deoxy-L-arabinose transferase-like glycosyltransferase